MEINKVYAIIRAFLKGSVDSVRGAVSLFYLDGKISEKVAASERIKRTDSARKKKPIPSANVKNPKVLKRIIQCCGLNGGVFWLSLILFEYVLLPCLNYLLVSLLGHSTVASTVWSWTAPVLYWIFSTLWVMPLFLLSKIVNTLWFQDIADSAFWCTQGRSHYFSSCSKFIADSLFSLVIQTLFLLQAMFVGLFPIAHLGEILSIVHMCMLYSLYAFEYKWCKLGWELHHRLLFIEANWPYFVGFGLPLSVLTALPQSYIVSACVFSILFPLFIISANEAKPVTKVCDVQLQLFSFVITLSNGIFNRTVKRTTTSVGTPQRKLKK